MLIGEGSRAWPHVLKRLHASDPQERFLAAVILARTHCAENLDLTVTVLVTHLKDNDWKGDATIAGRALHELGGGRPAPPAQAARYRRRSGPPSRAPSH